MPRRPSSPASSNSEHARLELRVFPLRDGAFDVRLVELSEKSKIAVEVDIEVEHIICVPRDYLESLGGNAPYDRIDLTWPLDRSDPLTETLAVQTALDEKDGRRGADLITFLLPEPLTYPKEVAKSNVEEKITYYPSVTTFYPWEKGVACQIGNSVFRFFSTQVGFLRKAIPGLEGPISFEICSLEELHATIEARNSALGLATPKWEEIDKSKKLKSSLKHPKDERKQDEFPVHTGEEWTAFIQTAADGKKLLHFSGNEQNGILRHQRPNAPFYTQTMLLEEERRAGHGIELLQNAAAQLDIDDGLAWLYISHLLAPPSPLAPNAYAGGWIDLDDVARKTMGGYARNPEEAKMRRVKVWRAICYGARSQIGGKRSVPYFDKTSGKEIPTEIYTSPWQIVSRQEIGQLPLFPDDEEDAPVRVELVASREWTALTTESSTAQYLPFGEVLGALPSNQAGGAWARVLGLAYIHWSRRRIEHALEGKELPSRQEFLDTFPSKVAPYRDILGSKDPRRALSYWQSAEMLLREMQIIETSATLWVPTSRKGWQEEWLGESPTWKPGALLREVLEDLQKKRFAPKSKPLKRPSYPKRARRDIQSPK